MVRAAALALAVLAIPRVPAAVAVPLDPVTAAPRREDAPRLELDRTGLAAVAATALAMWATAATVEARLDVDACRWCEPGAFDVSARNALRWRDTESAARASDVLRVGVPVGSAAAVAWLAVREGGWGEAAEDILTVAAALAVSAPLNSAVKHATGRLRPSAWAAGGPRSEGDLHSFYSGHASQVFTAAAAATQVTRLRARPGWRWLAAAAFAAAAGTAWLRVAADQHWATDVIAGAAAGTAIGLAVPPVMLRRRPGTTIVPAPGGIAVVF